MEKNDKIFEHALDNDKEWRKLLLDQNEKLFEKIDTLNDNFTTKCIQDEKRLTKLEIKSGFFGFIGGVLSTLGIHIWK